MAIPFRTMLRRALDFFRKNDIDWGIFGFIAGYHVVLAIALPVYLAFGSPSLPLLAWTLALLTVTMLSITMGYHRLFSHRTYEAAGIVEWLLVFFGSVTLQGSIVKWSHDHRLHHKHVDRDGDPYGTQLGFWHSHVLWMFKRQAPVNESLVKDLLRDPVIRSQHEHYLAWAIGSNVITTVGIGLLAGDLWGGFVFAFLLRLFLSHHGTWFINSIAHIWGSRPYSTEHSAVNNFVIALLTFGEGYHNYHHTFAGDYRNGIKWYHFDPSKHMIWLLSKVGLTRNLKRVGDLTIKKRLVAADRALLLDHLRSVAHESLAGWRQAGQERLDHAHESLAGWRHAGQERLDHAHEAYLARIEATRRRVEEASHAVVARIAELKEAVDAYRAARRVARREEVTAAKARIAALRAEVQAEWKAWQQLVNEVLSVRPVSA